MPRLTETMARRAVERAVADRHESYAAEIQRIVEATYDLIERTGDVDPSLRDVLRETGLSTQAFYRYFTTKDELLLVLLDDGRRRLLGYLEHRIARFEAPEDRLRAWVEGVLAQAAEPAAAARTRPFVANQDRLAERFPEEQQVSVDLLVGQVGALLDAVRGETETEDGDGGDDGDGGGGGGGGATRESQRDATAAYRLVFAALHAHLAHRTTPTAPEMDHLVGFITGGIRAGKGVHRPTKRQKRAKERR